MGTIGACFLDYVLTTVCSYRTIRDTAQGVKSPMSTMFDEFDELLGNVPAASPLVQPIEVTLFSDVHATTKEELRLSTRGIVELAASRTAPSKAKLPLFKCARFGSVASERGSLRHDSNLLAITAVVVDYDGETVSISEAAARAKVAGVAAAFLASPSHTATKPRWRAVAPLSQAAHPDEHARLCARFNGALGGILAPESFTRSQAYYVGRPAGAPHLEVATVEGRALDTAAELDAGALGRDGLPYREVLAEPTHFDTNVAFDIARAAAALAAIPVSAADEPASGGRDLWRDLGMALHHASGGSDEARELWTDWSKPGAKYKGERDQRRAWKSFAPTEGRPAIGIGSLYRTAKLYGWAPPPVIDIDAALAELDDLPDLLPDEPGDPVVRRLNRRHAVVAVKGRTLITTEQRDGAVAFGTVRDLETFYANDRIALPGNKVETAATRWLRSLDRRTYPDGVTFAPSGTTPGMLNLWRGWAVEADPSASCDLFLTHVREVVAGGSIETADYILGWLAHLVQRPEEKPGVALVLRGEKGTGKDTFADYVVRMIGRRHAPTVAESDHIVGKFNARLQNALLLHVQEGSWAGDRKAESVLKYLVTSDQIEIEQKGIDSFSVPSVLRLFISANASWVVPASADERRWAVFEVSSAKRRDDAYFTALREEMNGSGPAALLHFLRNRDLTSFNVRHAPDTEGLRNQKIASLRGVSLWWFELLNRGELQEWGCSWADEGQVIGREALRGYYLTWCKGRRFDGDPVDEVRFGRMVREMLPALESRRPRDKQSGRVRQYALPALSDCRAAFEGWIGGRVEWEAA